MNTLINFMVLDTYNNSETILSNHFITNNLKCLSDKRPPAIKGHFCLNADVSKTGRTITIQFLIKFNHTDMKYWADL